jgi:hypothetical protein
MSVATNRPTWGARFPAVASVALGLASLLIGIAWKTIGGGAASGITYAWVSGVLASQAGLFLAASAGIFAPRGFRWRAALPGFIASGVALAFWALSR